MNNWNNLKQSFQKLINNPNFKAMLGSPVTKIVGINTAMFVQCILFSCYGESRVFPRLF